MTYILYRCSLLLLNNMTIPISNMIPGQIFYHHQKYNRELSHLQHSNTQQTPKQIRSTKFIFYFTSSGWCAGEDGTHVQTKYSLSHHSCQYWCTDDFLINEKRLATQHCMKPNVYITYDWIWVGKHLKKKKILYPNIMIWRGERTKMNIMGWESLITPTYQHTDNTLTLSSSVLITTRTQ